MANIVVNFEFLKIDESKIPLEGKVELILGKYDSSDNDNLARAKAHDIAVEKGFLNRNGGYNIYEEKDCYEIFKVKMNDTSEIGFDNIEVGKIKKSEMNLLNYNGFLTIFCGHSEKNKYQRMVDTINDLDLRGINAKLFVKQTMVPILCDPNFKGITIDYTSDHQVNFFNY